jgi:hypothetical protein
LAPTVDAHAGTVTLRRSGRLPERASESGIPLILGFPGARLALQGVAAAPMSSPAGRSALRGRRWTVDLHRGVIWVDTPR